MTIADKIIGIRPFEANVSIGTFSQAQQPSLRYQREQQVEKVSLRRAIKGLGLLCIAGTAGFLIDAAVGSATAYKSIKQAAARAGHILMGDIEIR